jgi:ribonuclease I
VADKQKVQVLANELEINNASSEVLIKKETELLEMKADFEAKVGKLKQRRVEVDSDIKNLHDREICLKSEIADLLG